MVGQKQLYMYGAIGLAFLGFLFSILGGGSVLSLLGGFFCLVGAVSAVVLMKFGYVVMPIITGQAKMPVYFDQPYELSPQQDAIIKKVGNEYYASSFLVIKIFESSTEKTLDENVVYNEYFERAISNMKYVTKITYMVFVEDISKKRRALETKRAEARLRLAREKDKPEPDVLKIDKYERDVAMFDHMINQIIKGEKPMGVVAYAMTSAKGISREAALAEVRAQAKELRTLLANSLNVEVEQLTANEMLRCFEWEMFFPSSREEFEDEMV